MPAAAPAAPRGPAVLAGAVWLLALGLGGALFALDTGRLRWPDASGDAEAGRLQAAISARQAALAAAGCSSDGEAGLASPRPPAAVPAPPVSAPASSTDPPLSRDALVRLAETGVVLVLTDSASGSGFFVGPDLIVTNRHVIEEQRDGQVLVTSKSLGHVIPGRVIAATAKGPVGAPDFALIRVAPPMGAARFALTKTAGKLESIVVAGYPGLVIERDEGLKRLIGGDVNAAPDLNLNDGTVSAIEASAQGVDQIVHSAAVLKGNSGGPLIDRCGRIVGINTFIAVDSSQSGRVNYALASAALLHFLQANNVAVAVRDGPCA